jgi:cytochrome oxidase Cu insertion factor (SCO1/SenC/PrrC family)
MRRAGRRFRYYKRIPTSGGYVTDHTAILYLMDASGKFVGPIAYQEKTASAVAKLKEARGTGRAFVAEAARPRDLFELV